MPIVHFRQRAIECEPGANLRQVLLDGDSPHNGRARWMNCKGFGTCGTCAVRIEGQVPPPSKREQWRLKLPPHTPDSGLRLACQVQVESDLRISKFPGFWGQEVPEPGSDE